MLSETEAIIGCRGVFYSAEELIAMILQKAKEYAETFAGRYFNGRQHFLANLHKLKYL